ncbi:SAVMC3_10250 family protein [Nocardia nova]
MYHEFLYISGSKIDNFVPTAASWWRNLRLRKISAKAKVTPVEAGADFELADIAGNEQRLRNLIADFEHGCVDYTDPDIENGEWVMFEGRIGIAHLDDDPAGAVLFCQAEPLSVTTPRIVLHGSARNVATNPAASSQSHDRPGKYSVSVGATEQVVKALVDANGSDKTHGLRNLFKPSTKEPTDLEHNLGTYFREVACSPKFREFAPYLGGHARVSGVVHPPQVPFPIVLASPLYVRYERP